MSSDHFFARLRELGIRIHAEGGALKVSAPKGAMTNEIRDEIARRKQEILSLVTSVQTGPSASQEPLRSERRGDDATISFGQQRLWFLDRLAEGKAIYSIPGAVRIRGPLSVDALERSLSSIIERHEILRTIYLEVGEGVVQRVCRADPFRLVVEDLCAVPGAAEERLREVVREETSRSFDLQKGPVIRGRLLKHGRDEHVLILNIHHIAADGWSFAIIVRELGQLYEAHLAGREPALAALPMQYADYAMWQRRTMNAEVLDGQLQYWKAQLGGDLPVVDLPFARPRPLVQSYRSGCVYGEVGADVTSALKAAGREHGATLFMVLLAAFQMLVFRLTGEQDVIVGTPIANRRRTGFEGMVGFFLNTLALRTTIDPESSFWDLLARVRETTLEAYANQDLPFEEIVAAVNPVRSANRAPIFQSMFVLQNAPAEPLKLGGLELELLELQPEVSEYDLNFQLLEEAHGLRAAVQYSKDLFEREDMEELMAIYRTLLGEIAASPKSSLSELGIVPALMRQQLRQWNDTDASFPPACIDEQFVAQARRSPDSIAVQFGDQSVSFEELDAIANRIARCIREQDLAPGTPVGVMLPRSIQMLASLLGVWKAGRAYLPLDPGYPPSRRAFMVADSGAQVIVTTEDLAREFNVPDVRMLDVRSALGAEPEAPVDLAVAKNAAADAYLIYTSGSTGQPKGVRIAHAAVSNFLSSMAREPGMAAGDRVLSVTTVAFDISVLELFLPLVRGGTVVIASEEAIVDPAVLASELELRAITVMQATPATWRMLVESGWGGHPGLVALCGGEAMSRSLADALLDRCGSVWNMYGPTETTVWSAVHRVERGVAAVPIGRPIDNTRFHVLDERHRLVPIGVAGELWIGGAGVSVGYHGRDELNAERFRDSALDPHGRIYRTGDRVRRLRDGTLEFQGRLDLQVKLRGFRIELGEIEAALTRHPAVRTAVVVVRRDERIGEERLVAYLVSAGSADMAPEKLRNWLAETLPLYMIPSVFVQLDNLPLTHNGKIDRKSLPEPGAARPALDRFLPPSTRLESELTEAWRDVLKVDKVGIEDNFFDLGGTSLLLVQVQKRIRERAGRDVALIDFFRSPTVKALAERLTSGMAEATTANRIAQRVTMQRAALSLDGQAEERGGGS